ncbi:hypothetical protein LENED_012134 [Lentinula edodes]|uniref:Uncharacterized protein n=1 Tax=Lentinula edodes TaxID=5353 RepID=A0A1Q3ERT7_LENED|nr:hypothetical protein LENED_012134 [Lentinula edodes]
MNAYPPTIAMNDSTMSKSSSHLNNVFESLSLVNRYTTNTSLFLGSCLPRIFLLNPTTSPTTMPPWLSVTMRLHSIKKPRQSPLELCN